MSYEKFIKSQIKIQKKLSRIALPDRPISNDWLDQMDKVKKSLPQNFSYVQIDKLINRPAFTFTNAENLKQVTKLMEPITFPVRDLTEIFQYRDVLKEIKKIFQVPKNPSDWIDVSKNAFFSFRQFDLSELVDQYEVEEETTSIVINESSRIKQIISDVYHNNEIIHTIEPRHFEELIAELLFKQGFEVELTKQTRDNGFDILALKYIKGFSPIKYLVECKRHAEGRKVGIEIVRSFKEVLQTEKANKGIIVTTSYFTKPAIIKQAETPYLLDFKDKTDVIKWVVDYYSKH